MRTRKSLLASTLLALAALGLPWAVADANHIKIEVTPEHQQPPATVIVPGPPAVTPGPPAAPSYVPAPQTLQAEEIRAHQVRAQTIYANKIEADEVQGAVHHSKGVKVGDSRGEIKAPYVTASVIYADVIKANSVVADNIYVRDLERR
jgi:hypothetical protein